MAIGRFEYHVPGSLGEALSILESHGDRAGILAGGTDLIVQMKDGKRRPEHIVDVKRIPELNRLEWSEGEGLHIGAALCLKKLIAFAPLTQKFDILAQACSVVGSMQVRNRATLGGNLCNAAPSADTAPSLLCLGAEASVASSKGTRTIPLEGFFLGPGKTALEPGELLVEVVVPTPSVSSAGCYLRHGTRAEMDIAVVGVASFVVLSPGEKTVQDARIAMGAVAPTPVRVRKAEEAFTGAVATRKAVEEAAQKAAEAARPISDLRGSAEYRSELVKVLTRRSLEKACGALGIEI